MNMPSVHINGLQLHYQTGGSGVPLVMIEGGFASLMRLIVSPEWFEWGEWEEDFASWFKLITYHRRGCWPTTLPADGYALDNQASDLAALLDHLLIETAHVAASSSGGPIAIVFAATQPRRVRSLVLTGTALQLFPERDPASDTIRGLIRVLKREGAEAAFDQRPDEANVTLGSLWEIDEARAAGTVDSFIAARRGWSIRASQVDRQTRVRYFEAELHNIDEYMKSDIVGLASMIAAPTLVVHGALDATVSLNAARHMQQIITGAQMEVITNVGHGALYKSPQARKRAKEFMRYVDRVREA